MSRTHAIRLAFALLAIAFFATPIAARVLGITAESFENRSFAGPPKLSQGWDAFPQATQFLIDRMPLRKQAIQANTHIWTDLFDTTPRYGEQAALAQEGALSLAGGQAGATEGEGGEQTPDTAAQVLRGEDGWLYVQAEMGSTCAPALPPAQALAEWRSLLTTIRATGARALLVVAPDKGSIYPEHVAGFPGDECLEPGKRVFWRALEADERRGGAIALRDDLLALKPGLGDDLYARKDSHWTTVGSLTLVGAVLARLGEPGVEVLREEVVDPGPTEYTGDLTKLLGAPETDVQQQRTIERAPGAPRIPGRTLLIGDSYSIGPTPQLAHYFDDLTRLTWVQTPVPELARAIRGADTVLLESVERELSWRATDVVARLERQLRD